MFICKKDKGYSKLYAPVLPTSRQKLWSYHLLWRKGALHNIVLKVCCMHDFIRIWLAPYANQTRVGINILYMSVVGNSMYCIMYYVVDMPAKDCLQIILPRVKLISRADGESTFFMLTCSNKESIINMRIFSHYFQRK